MSADLRHLVTLGKKADARVRRFSAMPRMFCALERCERIKCSHVPRHYPMKTKSSKRSWPRLLLLLLPATFLTGCSTFRKPELASAKPAFEPLEFFSGRTTSTGTFESPPGKPRQTFVTTGWGRLDHGSLLLYQSVIYEPGHSRRRIWCFRKVSDGHYEGTANDVVGIAKGKMRGNTFYLDYTVAQKAGDPSSSVRVRQKLFLQPDGAVVSRTTFLKSHARIAAVTERFERLSKESERPSSRGQQARSLPTNFRQGLTKLSIPPIGQDPASGPRLDR
jgi:Protein of unknown function (DUF3833)